MTEYIFSRILCNIQAFFFLLQVSGTVYLHVNTWISETLIGLCCSASICWWFHVTTTHWFCFRFAAYWSMALL